MRGAAPRVLRKLGTMREQGFITRRQPEWKRLEALVALATARGVARLVLEGKSWTRRLRAGWSTLADALTAPAAPTTHGSE